MKKLVSVLLALAMVLTMAGAASAACSIKKDTFVTFTRDSAAYTAARSGKKTKDVVRKCSTTYCDKICGKYARLIVTISDNQTRWFKVADLKEETNPKKQYFDVVWAKGGKGMSKKTDLKGYSSDFKGKLCTVTGHTNLRKTPSLHLKSQGVVKKGDKLKLTGHVQLDDRLVAWWQICRKGRKLWISENFIRVDKQRLPIVD